MLAVGLNLSSNRIYAVELLKSGKNLAIRKMVRSELPSNSIVKGEIQDPAILTRGLKDIWRKYRISDRKVFIGISNQKVIAKEIKIPVVDDAEIDNSIKYQINDFIPIPKNNIIYDYYVVEKEENFSRLMLVGAMKSMIDDVVKSFKDAGLLAQAIDLNCFSLYRTVNYINSVEKNTKNKKPDTFCVVNLGLEMSIIEMIQDDNLKYPRFTSTSIKNFIDGISKEVKKDNKYCEEIISGFDFKSLFIKKNDNAGEVKKEEKKDLPGKIGEKEDKKSDKDSTQSTAGSIDVTKIMKDTTDHLIGEIKLSIEHFLQENPKYKVGKIILTGEYIKNIDKYIEKEIGYKVELLNIADYFSLKYLKRNPQYKGKDLNYLLDPLAIGMALRGLNK
ncbi:MAG TPA: pilus assembly protein PilM [Candidatus Hydromicrobium sp.]